MTPENSMAKRRKIKTVDDGRRFDADVWNCEGDVVAHRRDLTYDELQEFIEEYEDDPFHSVAVEEC